MAAVSFHGGVLCEKVHPVLHTSTSCNHHPTEQHPQAPLHARRFHTALFSVCGRPQSGRERQSARRTGPATAALETPSLGSSLSSFGPATSSLTEAAHTGTGTREHPRGLQTKNHNGAEGGGGARQTGGVERLEVDAFYAEDMVLRRVILEQHWEVSSARLPWEGVEAAIWEALGCVCESLALHHPHMFRQEGGGALFVNKATQELYNFAGRGMEPLWTIGNLVQDDFLLMLPDETGRMRLAAGVASFPLHWRLLESLGQTLSDLPLPLPFGGTAAASQPAVDAVENVPAGSAWLDAVENVPAGRAWLDAAEKVPAGRAWLDEVENVPAGRAWRSSSAAIVDGRELYQPHEEVAPNCPGDYLFAQSHGATAMRLPRSGAVAIFLRSHVRPLHAFDERPALASDLVRALEALPEEGGRAEAARTAREYLSRIVQQHVAAGNYLTNDADEATEGRTTAGYAEMT